MDGQRAGAIIIHKAEFPELVHEMTDSRPCGAHHLGQVFLIDSGKGCTASTFFANLCKQQKNPGQAFLTEIEESIYEIFFDSDHAGKQTGDEELGEGGLLMDQSKQRCLSHAGDRGELNRRCGRHAQGFVYQTTLSKHVARPQNRDNRLFAARRGNRELHVAIPDVEHRIGRIPLRIDGLAVLVLPSRLLRADLSEEFPGIKGARRCAHS